MFKKIRATLKNRRGAGESSESNRGDVDRDLPVNEEAIPLWNLFESCHNLQLLDALKGGALMLLKDTLAEAESALGGKAAIDYDKILCHAVSVAIADENSVVFEDRGGHTFRPNTLRYVSIARYLIEEKGADVEARPEGMARPIFYAARDCNVTMIRLLNECAAKRNRQGRCSGQGEEDVVGSASEEDCESQRASGESVDRIPKPSALFHLTDEFGSHENETPLMIAARNIFRATSTPHVTDCARRETLRVLVNEVGCDVNHVNSRGKSVLSFILSTSYLPGYNRDTESLVRFLVGELGADVNNQRENCLPPLCVSGLSFDTVKFLVTECGANVDVFDCFGRTALETQANNPAVVRFLLGNGANLNLWDAHQTPLHRFLEKMRFGMIDLDQSVSLDIVAAFLDHGADVDARNATGQTPLHFAAQCPELSFSTLRPRDDRHVNTYAEGTAASASGNKDEGSLEDKRERARVAMVNELKTCETTLSLLLAAGGDLWAEDDEGMTVFEAAKLHMLPVDLIVRAITATHAVHSLLDGSRDEDNKEQLLPLFTDEEKRFFGTHIWIMFVAGDAFEVPCCCPSGDTDAFRTAVDSRLRAFFDYCEQLANDKDKAKLKGKLKKILAAIKPSRKR